MANTVTFEVFQEELQGIKRILGLQAPLGKQVEMITKLESTGLWTTTVELETVGVALVEGSLLSSLLCKLLGDKPWQSIQQSSYPTLL